MADKRDAPPPAPAPPPPSAPVQSRNDARAGISGDFGTTTSRRGGFTSGGTTDVGAPGYTAASGAANLDHPERLSPARLLYFSSSRSGPARRVEAFVDQVMQERQNHETFDRLTIDVDSSPDVARKFDVDVVPTILVVDDGRVVRRIEGRVSVPELRRQLSPWLR
jgi:thioredoxin 2